MVGKPALAMWVWRKGGFPARIVEKWVVFLPVFKVCFLQGCVGFFFFGVGGLLCKKIM